MGISGGFPGWLSKGDSTANPSVLGRTSHALERSTHQRTVHSYGQTRHRRGAFFLNGRLHIDLKNSFIVSEGGLSGLFELAQHSRQSAQIISRLSPGSVISAIQMRVAMDDGVLVPWKKIDLKTQSPLLICFRLTGVGCTSTADQGVHASVIELDFASLFPSIIATLKHLP